MRENGFKKDFTFFDLNIEKDKVDINCSGNLWVEQGFGEEGPGVYFEHFELDNVYQACRVGSWICNEHEEFTYGNRWVGWSMDEGNNQQLSDMQALLYTKFLITYHPVSL